jgi:hypothetical protein
MKAAALTNFNPAQVTIIKDAYELAKTAFESTQPPTKVDEDKLATAVIMLAKAGCLETQSLASHAVIRVLWSRKGQPSRQAAV